VFEIKVLTNNLTNQLTSYLTDSLTIYQLTPCSTVLPEKLTVPQLVKKFPTFCGVRMFMTV